MVPIFNDYRSACRLQKPRNQIEQRAFSRTAWAKHRNNLSLTHGEREAHRQMLVKPGYISQF